MTKKELEQGRYYGNHVVGYFKSFCELNDCCEKCDSHVRFWCKVKKRIEGIQVKRILKIIKDK